MAIDLITGHQGVSHISADQIATINNAMMDNFGANKVMRLVGGELTADGLTITISEGYWRVNGFDMEIQEGETLYIDPTTIGLSRIDDIYVEILQDIPTGAQRAEIYIALGEPSATPTAPDEPTAPYLNTDILLQIIKLARVTVSEGAMIMEDYSVAYNIVTPEALNTVDVKASSALSSATNALGMIQDDSDAYSSSKSYKVGDYVVHEDKIYKCITACSAAAWSVNQNCFEETTLTTAVTELNSNLGNKSSASAVSGSTAFAKIATLNSNLGNKSSASAVSGNDAFSKINTINTSLGNTNSSLSNILSHYLITSWISSIKFDVQDNYFVILAILKNGNKVKIMVATGSIPAGGMGARIYLLNANDAILGGWYVNSNGTLSS